MRVALMSASLASCHSGNDDQAQHNKEDKANDKTRQKEWNAARGTP